MTAGPVYSRTYERRTSHAPTNAFSRKVESHAHTVAFGILFYNLCCIHKTLRVTPAMAAKATNKLSSMEDVVAMLDAVAPASVKRGRHRKQSA